MRWMDLSVRFSNTVLSPSRPIERIGEFARTFRVHAVAPGFIPNKKYPRPRDASSEDDPGAALQRASPCRHRRRVSRPPPPEPVRVSEPGTASIKGSGDGAA